MDLSTCTERTCVQTADGHPVVGSLVLVYKAEYAAWRDMRNRCGNTKLRTFKHYGGRGISVCAQWAYSFPTFLNDMGPRPSKKHSLDRKDNNGGYTPDNCRWATREEQQRNRQDTRLLTVNGKTQCIKDWARETGIPNATLHGRLSRGWPSDRAVLAPIRTESRSTKKEMVGLAFGRLTVLSRAGTLQGRPMWLCACSCGTYRTVSGHNLRRGNTRSCGCSRSARR